MRLLYIFLCICLTFCSKRGDRIKNADKIEVFYYNRGDTLKYTNKTERAINIFRKILNEKSEKTTCDPSGLIRFLSKDKPMLQFEFSISGGSEGCQFLIENSKAWRLSYNAGMFLNENIADAKKE